ncbi:membrane-bound alkaline phosphatase-like [Lucilia cuprina]|uniref:membrane-bound alkaline phosphatase-like n=1 Tax=Lucilia cuprina TaxID=7375 RepID=UPI001F051080|nr:membrane-bound alkaline phosphatase-like [Lucilia cuprina]
MKSFVVLLSLVAATMTAVTPSDVHYHSVPNFVKQSKEDFSARGNLLAGMGANKYTLPHEANAEFWLKLAREELTQRVQQKPMNLNKAKNIIFFLGDGMSLTTVAAARIRKGQLKGNTGEEDALSFEKFPYSGLSKTYCANAQVPDSACTATAYLCGIKNNIVTIGVNAKVNYNNCSESEDPNNHVSSIAAWAQKAGKSTGIITTTTLSHASPAGAYAHTANRFWECDADILKWSDHNDPAQCTDIAQQLIIQEPGRNFDLMMGGGMGKFLPKHLKDLHGNMGQRLDGRNLLATWQGMHPNGVVVHDRNSLLSLNVSKVSHIMGLFQSGYMDYHAVSDKKKQPTLAEMTEVAIKFLSKNDKGYFVFIEGGQIDTANHANLAGISLDETLEMEKAVQKARDMTNPEETLIVVTSDHAHPLSIAGYPGRGTNILGTNQHDTDINGKKYTTLNYAAGTKQYLDDHGERLDIEGVFGKDIFTQYPSYIHTDQGVHAGDDVGIFASGPHEHLFRGVMEQHSIPHLMAYAACIGNGPTMCDNKE